MNRKDFLRQEIVEGPTRTPPMPIQQVAAHIKELRLLTRPQPSLEYIRALGHIPGCHLYDHDGERLGA